MAYAHTNIEIKPGLDNIRGPIAAGRFAPDTGKAASCPVRFSGALEGGKFVCSRQVVQLSDIKCPSNFPNYVARTSASSGLGDGYISGYVKNVHGVSPEDVRRTAEKYLDPARMTITVVGDRKTIEPQLEPYRAGVP